MIIIDKTKPPSPILEYKPKPDFKNDLERQRYWAKQKQSWIDGIGEIPGTLVHKTQEQMIKHRNTGRIFRPTCRDVDLMVHQEIKDCKAKGEALLIIKARGEGLSTDFGCLTNYHMRMYPGSTCFLTASDQDKVSALFSDKVMNTFNLYDEDIRPEVARLNETKKTSYLRAKIRSRDNEGKSISSLSEVYCKETSDNDMSASGFSGKGAIFGAFDELYLHKRRDLLLRSSASCFIEAESMKVVGFLLAGGSVEETVSNESLLQLQEMVSDVIKHRRLGILPARLLFIPAWMGKEMVNGHSNEKLAREKYEKTLEELSKLGDAKALRAYKMNNPMSLDDIFNLSSGSFFEEDNMESIKITLNELIKKENKGEVFEVPHIISNVASGYEAFPDKKGKIILIEQPKQGVGYVETIDGSATDKASGEDEGSNFASIIWKLFDPEGGSYTPVCFYSERPQTIKQAYIYSINMAHYYDKFGGFKKISAEGNASTASHLGTFLREQGLEKWILPRKDLSGKGNSNLDKDFQYIGIDARDWQIKQYNLMLRKHVRFFKSKTILADYLKPVDKNADLRDSSLMLTIYLPPNYDKPAVKKKPASHMRLYLEKRGDKMVRVWRADKQPNPLLRRMV